MIAKEREKRIFPKNIPAAKACAHHYAAAGMFLNRTDREKFV